VAIGGDLLRSWQSGQDTRHRLLPPTWARDKKVEIEQATGVR
jgi:hypothetical protein